MVYSKVYSRPYRIAIITTTTLSLMFTNALLYSLSYPETVCGPHNGNPSKCANQKARWGSAPLCQYDPDTSLCSYLPPDTSFIAQVALAIVGTIFTAPLNILIQQVFERMVLPSTKTRELIDYERQRSASITSSPTTTNPFTPHYVQAGFGDPSHDPKAEGVKMVQEAAKQKGPIHQLCCSILCCCTRPPHADAKVHPPPSEGAVDKSKTPRRQSKAEKQLAKKKEREKFEAFVDHETAKTVERAQEHRAELQDVVKLLEDYQSRLKQPDSHRQISSEEQLHLATWIIRLKKFQGEFDKRWSFDANGQLRGLTCWERLQGTSPLKRLRKSIKRDLIAAGEIEEQILDMPEDVREIRLMEYVRVDFLNNTERKIYLRNKIDFSKELAPHPVPVVVKTLGWGLIGLVNIFFALYIILFGIKQGSKTTNSWLLSFLIGIIQDPAINLPVLIIFYHVYLPLLIRQRIKVRIDGARMDPYKFSTFIPSGPGCRVAMKHPEWVSSTLINRFLGIREDSSTAIDANGQPNTDAHFHAKIREQSMDHFLKTEAVVTMKPLLISFAIVSVMLMLPDKLQETLLNNLVAIATGGAVVGWGIFQQMNPFAAYGVLAGLILLLGLVISWQMYRHSDHGRKQNTKIQPVGQPQEFTKLPIIGGDEDAIGSDTKAVVVKGSVSVAGKKYAPTSTALRVSILQQQTPDVVSSGFTGKLSASSMHLASISSPGTSPPSGSGDYGISPHLSSYDLVNSEGELDMEEVHKALRTLHEHKEHKRPSGASTPSHPSKQVLRQNGSGSGKVKDKEDKTNKGQMRSFSSSSSVSSPVVKTLSSGDSIDNVTSSSPSTGSHKPKTLQGRKVSSDSLPKSSSSSMKKVATTTSPPSHPSDVQPTEEIGWDEIHFSSSKATHSPKKTAGTSPSPKKGGGTSPKGRK